MGTAVRGLLVAAGEGHTAVRQGGMHGGLRRAGKQGVGCAGRLPPAIALATRGT